MKATALRRFQVRVFEEPLKRPFVTALGRKDKTVNVELTLELSSGAAGRGEASGSLAFAHLRPERLAAVMTRLARAAVGRDALELRPLVERAWKAAGLAAPAAAAFEAALLSAVCAERGLTLFEWFGGACRRGETDVTISAVDPGSSAEAAREAARAGYRALKVKVGTGLKADLARVRAVVAAAPGRRLLLDGNQGMTVASALRVVEGALSAGARVELLEQPLPKDDLKALARLCRRCPVPVALDESVKTPQDALRALEAGAAGAFNVKAAKSGYLRSQDIVALARAAGLPLMIGCMMETAPGLFPSVALALGTGAFRWLDLDSDALLLRRPEGSGWSRRGPDIALS